MDHDRMWSHPLPDPWVNLGPGRVVFPSEEFSPYGLNSLAYTNFASTTNYPAMPNLNIVVPNYVRANVGMSQDPYMHYLIAHNSSRFPPYYAQHELFFNHLNAGDLSGRANSSVDSEITTYKRNVLTLQNFSDSTSTNTCYNVASYFNHPVSTGILDSRHALGLNCHAWNPNNMVSGCRSNNMLSSEESQRKVRGQRTVVIHPGSISSDHFHSRATATVLNAPGQWNHAAPMSLNSYTSHVHTSGQPTPHLTVDHDICEQGTNYRPNITDQPLNFEANMVDIGLPDVETDVLQSHSRELSTIMHSDERDRRNLALVDQPMFYDSWNLLDENDNMRLDIDNMSYEELLALEEHIGNVNTGLSESAIAKCLSETIYFSDRMLDSQEEVPCAICLESHKDLDCVGRLHCGHDFHACCIKKWLQIKNICPICKASAMEKALVE